VYGRPRVVLRPEKPGHREPIRKVQHVIVNIRHAQGRQLGRLLVGTEKHGVGEEVHPAALRLVESEGAVGVVFAGNVGNGSLLTLDLGQVVARCYLEIQKNGSFFTR
jgi:hypothetical protein